MAVPGRWWLFAVGIGLLLVPVTLFSPTLAVVGVAAFVAFALVARFAARMQTVFLGLLGVCLIGYAFLGRGFAYVGVAPLFVGEVVLAVGLAALVLHGWHAALSRSPIVWAIAVYMAVGLAASLPHVGRYGLDVARDSVLWIYAAFALLVATTLLRTDLLGPLMHRYARWLPWFLVWAPVALMIRGFVDVPTVPGSDVEIISTKAGDTSVHLAGILVFLALSLHRAFLPHARLRLSLNEWWWWAVWAGAAALAFTVNRGGMMSVAVVIFVLTLLRPLSRWAKLLTVSVALGAVFFASGIEINHASRRAFSAESLMENVLSVIPGRSESTSRDGTAEWRLSWWEDIFEYTVRGPFFWTGKGYGVNLATADGYQTSNGQNRNPHNGHMTVLARSGVPGLVAWLIVLASIGLSLFRAYLRSRRDGRDDWSRINLWVLCYWLAFVVNGSFDVFFEGPQGGIWYWSLVGLAIAILEMQRLGRPAPFGSGAAPARLGRRAGADARGA